MLGRAGVDCQRQPGRDPQACGTMTVAVVISPSAKRWKSGSWSMCGAMSHVARAPSRPAIVISGHPWSAMISRSRLVWVHRSACCVALDGRPPVAGACQFCGSLATPSVRCPSWTAARCVGRGASATVTGNASWSSSPAFNAPAVRRVRSALKLRRASIGGHPARRGPPARQQNRRTGGSLCTGRGTETAALPRHAEQPEAGAAGPHLAAPQSARLGRGTRLQLWPTA